MTNPLGAIGEDTHGIPGTRLYARPDFDLGKFRSPADTAPLLRDGVIFPSVTTIIGMLPKGHLQGWYGREAVKALDATFTIVEDQRKTALRAMAAAGVSADVIVEATSRDVPPSLLATARTHADIEKARTLGARWVRVATLALSGKHTPGHVAKVLAGGRMNAETQGRALYARFKDGEITQSGLELAQAEAEAGVLEVLRSHPDGWWVYTQFASDTKGVALLGNAASRSRDTAADYGTDVHNMLEWLSLAAIEGNTTAPTSSASIRAILAGVTVEETGRPAVDHYRPGANDTFHAKAWHTWWTKNKPTDVHPELTVRGVTPEGLPYAGTADMFACIDGVGHVIDYKTSRSLSENVAVQMAALSKAADTPFEVNIGIGLHLPRPEDAQKLLRFAREDQVDYQDYRKGYRAFEVAGESLESAWRLFCAARALWQELHVSGAGA